MTKNRTLNTDTGEPVFGKRLVGSIYTTAVLWQTIGYKSSQINSRNGGKNFYFPFNSTKIPFFSVAFLLTFLGRKQTRILHSPVFINIAAFACLACKRVPKLRLHFLLEYRIQNQTGSKISITSLFYGRSRPRGGFVMFLNKF